PATMASSVAATGAGTTGVTTVAAAGATAVAAVAEEMAVEAEGTRKRPDRSTSPPP
ncbi:MAG: hypothetical protein H0X57_00775, partial [Rubrobacter sp.]|nr:hypothetical protein [Rubrobacter sp.]